MTAFFDRALADIGGAAFIRTDRIDEMLRRLVPGAKITRGSYRYPATAELRDLGWNHMDQAHRPFIHRTYGDAARIFLQEHAAFSLTRFGRWPIVLPVFDGRFTDNGFYQIILLFGLFVIVSTIECESASNGTCIHVRWAIASHWTLSWLHPVLNRRLVKLNELQNREDDPIRDRRVELRAGGYRFKTDNADFFTSNVIDDNVIFPVPCDRAALDLATLADNTVVRRTMGERAYVLRRRGTEVDVWPGVCLHEGAVLDAAHVAGTTINCPWHGLTFPAQSLSEGGAIDLCGARLSLNDGKIEISRPSSMATGSWTGSA